MNKSQKRKRLAEIADEVGELHPLLQELLPQMPNIQYVEC